MAFWILAPIMVIAALGILFVRKAVHAALLLAVVMISLAVLYAALDAPFLFAVQIIVYTGAILMLFLFVLMLVGVDASDSVVETIRGQRLFAVLGGLVLGLVLVIALARSPSARSSGSTRPTRAATSRRWPTSCSPSTSSPSRPPRRCSSPLRSARWCWPTGSGSRRSPARPTRPPCGCRTTPQSGKHPGPLPAPGVFARHNAVDTAALLPDGTAAESSVSRVLAARGTVRSAPALADDIEEVQRQLGVSVADAPEAGGNGPGRRIEHDRGRGRGGRS